MLVEEGTEHFQFWKAIPGGKTAIRPADYPAPVDVPPCRKQDLQLYRVTSESPLAWELVSGQPLQRASLAASDWFIVSTGVALYTWVGKLAGLGTERVVLAATEFVEAQGLSSWTPIEMMSEGGETEAFKLLFEGFEPPAAGLPRFFRLVQGQLDEIVGFGPADLDVQSVCMLDVVSEMFVWLGAESVASDSKVAEAVAGMALYHQALLFSAAPQPTIIHKFNQGYFL